MTFTDKKPVTPGAYWWRINFKTEPVLTVVIEGSAGELFMNSTNCTEGRVLRVGGLWSSRLVPVEEVERAYREGAKFASYGPQHYNFSRARRVVEGKEGV